MQETGGKEGGSHPGLNMSIPAILTSGSIMTIVGYILYNISSVAAIGDLGHLIGRGAWMSMLLVCTLLPGLSRAVRQYPDG